MDKELLIKLQREKSHRILSQADDMVEQMRWDIAANRFYYACYHMCGRGFRRRDQGDGTYGKGICRSNREPALMIKMF